MRRARDRSAISYIRNIYQLLAWLVFLLAQNSLAQPDTVRLSTFDIDVTPPVGSHLSYDPEINKWDLGLRAKGIVLIGSGLPIVTWAQATSERPTHIKKAAMR